MAKQSKTVPILPETREVKKINEETGEEYDRDDELPWQMIAILDEETLRDMRYTFRCYEANIKQ